MLQHGLLFLHVSAGPGRGLLHLRLPTGSQPHLGIQLLQRVVFHGLQVDICSTVDLHGLQGDSLPHHGLHHGLQGKTFYSGILRIFSPSFFTDPAVCRVVSLTWSHSSLSTAAPQQVFPLPKYAVAEALPLSLMGSVLASSGSILEPAGIGSIRHGGSFSQLLTEATPL